MLPPWMVVETRRARDGQVVRVIHHTRVNGSPMSERDARELVAMEQGRYAGAADRRTFHAEPVTTGGVS
jgi:hypothetical protein